MVKPSRAPPLEFSSMLTPAFPMSTSRLRRMFPASLTLAASIALQPALSNACPLPATAQGGGALEDSSRCPGPDFHGAQYPVAWRTAKAVFAGDCDGDGKPDLLVGSSSGGYASGTVSVLSNRGYASFGPPLETQLSGGVWTAVASDWDNDGDLDLAVSIIDQRWIQVLTNDGNGSFTSTQYDLGGYPTGLVAVDLDRDGDDELAVSTTVARSMSILDNLGNGQFSAPVVYAMDSDPSPFVAADVDGDGDSDLVISKDRSYVLRNQGDGRLGAPEAAGPPVFPRQMTSSDFDGDGDPDLALVTSLPYTVTVLSNDGTGLFSSAWSHPFLKDAQAFTSVDLEQDGDMDLLVAGKNVDVHSSPGLVTVFTNEGSGTFAAPVGYLAGTAPNSMASTDLDDDGDLDVVLGNEQTSASCSVSMLLNDRGVLQTFELYRIGPGALTKASMTSADLDADGDLDLCTNADPDRLLVLRNDGEGGFVPDDPISLGVRAWSVESADLDRDGHVDLVATIRDEERVLALLNLGDGSFGIPLAYRAGAEPTSLEIADLDGDEYPDLVACNWSTQSVSVLLNRGNGSFRPPVSYLIGDRPSSLTSADLDGDADTDLAVVGGLAGTLSILLNQGDGRFTPANSTSLGGDPDSISHADLDHDGDFDLAIADYIEARVMVFLNQGNARFVPGWSSPTGGTPNDILCRDTDGDGHSDLLMSHSGPNSVSIFPGRGDGTFGPERRYGTGFSPVGLVAADLDGRGRLDIATVNAGVWSMASQTVSVLLSLCR